MGAATNPVMAPAVTLLMIGMMMMVMMMMMT
jgi:hypothetical protein